MDQDWAQVCDNATWVLVFRKLDHDTYALESAGGVSLVTHETLEEMLRLTLRGEENGLGVGGGHVG